MSEFQAVTIGMQNPMGGMLKPGGSRPSQAEVEARLQTRAAELGITVEQLKAILPSPHQHGQHGGPGLGGHMDLSQAFQSRADTSDASASLSMGWQNFVTSRTPGGAVKKSA